MGIAVNLQRDSVRDSATADLPQHLTSLLGLKVVTYTPLGYVAVEGLGIPIQELRSRGAVSSFTIVDRGRGPSANLRDDLRLVRQSN